MATSKSMKGDFSPRILIFSWNHQALRICETLDPKIKKYHRAGYLGMGLATTYRYDCEMPDFFGEWKEIIEKEDPEIVVFGSQEDASPGSYMHSDFLPGVMEGELKYNLLKRTKLMGIGVETYKAAQKLEIKFRGLRLSVYIKPGLKGYVELEEKYLRDVIGFKGQSHAVCDIPYIKQSKGAIASYLKLPGSQVIAFICGHLPFDAASLKEAYVMKNIEDALKIRGKAVAHSNNCFNYLLKSLVFDANVLLKSKTDKWIADRESHTHSRVNQKMKANTEILTVDHVFFFGDLNYRALSVDEDFELRFDRLDRDVIQNIIKENDELHRVIASGDLIIDFKEGVDNEGPMFMPTCKMNKPRDNRISLKLDDKVELGEVEKFSLCGLGTIQEQTILETPFVAKGGSRRLYNIGAGQRKPSWSDRILYADLGEDGYNTECLLYGRLDSGETMKKSDHAAIYGLYRLIRNP